MLGPRNNGKFIIVHRLIAPFDMNKSISTSILIRHYIICVHIYIYIGVVTSEPLVAIKMMMWPLFLGVFLVEVEIWGLFTLMPFSILPNFVKLLKKWLYLVCCQILINYIKNPAKILVTMLKFWYIFF